MNIVIGSMMQETNTFSPIPTDRQAFINNYLYYDEAVINHLTGTRTELGGFLDILHKENKRIIPTIAAMAIAGGKVTAEAYDHFKKEIITRISKAHQVEGILLALHGAMVADQCNDPEGELLIEIREIVGPHIPIAISLDPHAHVTEKMIKTADIIVGYKTFPHVDHYETGQRTAALLLEMISGQLTPTMEAVNIPMLISPEAQDDSAGPMEKIINLCQQMEQEGNVDVVNFFPVQPWLDIPHTTTVALVLSNNNPEAAKRSAQILAEKAWELKDEFTPIRLKPQEAIQRAAQSKEGPVVIAETSDSTLAGAPGDGAFLLQALIDEEFQENAYVTIVDPKVVNQIHSKTIGATVQAEVGHTLDDRWGTPVEIKGTLYYKSDGKFPLQQTGVIESMGKTVVIRSNNLYVVVCENPFAHLDPNSYKSVKLNPADAKIIGVKSTLHFRAFYKDISSEIILLDTLGVSNGNFKNINWEKLSRPRWPLDRFE